MSQDSVRRRSEDRARDSRQTVVYILPQSGQFRSVEVATLEKGQRHLKDPGLASLEFEFLPTLRRRADCSEFFLVLSKFGLLSNHNPSPTFCTSDA